MMMARSFSQFEGWEKTVLADEVAEIGPRNGVGGLEIVEDDVGRNGEISSVEGVGTGPSLGVE